MKSGFVLSTLLLAAVALSAPIGAAQLYQWKDAQGRTVYSDQPPPASIKNGQQKNFKGSVIEGGESYAVKVARERHPVTLYTSACGAPCDEARALLIQRGVPFSSKDLQTSEDARNEVQKLTGKLNVPILMVGGDKIEGFAADRWHAALTRAGYPSTPAPGARPAVPAAPVPIPTKPASPPAS